MGTLTPSTPHTHRLSRMTDQRPEKKQKTYASSGINCNFALDKEFEVKSLSVVAESPVSCLQGLAERADSLLSEFHIKTVKDLANWKYGLWASAIVDLAETEEGGRRAEDATMNVDKAVDKDQRGKSLKELVDADVAALSGISDAGSALLKKLNVKTIGKLGSWKYIKWSRAIVALAEKEDDGTKSNRELDSLLK